MTNGVNGYIIEAIRLLLIKTQALSDTIQAVLCFVTINHRRD
jgi:hypothetical protein